jgi:hypothetical protein
MTEKGDHTLCKELRQFRLNFIPLCILRWMINLFSKYLVLLENDFSFAFSLEIT